VERSWGPGVRGRGGGGAYREEGIQGIEGSLWGFMELGQASPSPGSSAGSTRCAPRWLWASHEPTKALPAPQHWRAPSAVHGCACAPPGPVMPRQKGWPGRTRRTREGGPGRVEGGWCACGVLCGRQRSRLWSGLCASRTPVSCAGAVGAEGARHPLRRCSAKAEGRHARGSPALGVGVWGGHWTNSSWLAPCLRGPCLGFQASSAFPSRVRPGAGDRPMISGMDKPAIDFGVRSEEAVGVPYGGGAKPRMSTARRLLTVRAKMHNVRSTYFAVHCTRIGTRPRSGYSVQRPPVGSSWRSVLFC